MGFSVISPEEFVRAWQTSSRNKEVCKKLGMKPNTVANRAKKYRELGVNLKEFPSSRHEIDVNALNEICAYLDEDGHRT